MSMFIVPMDAEGVTVRGLRQISGEAEFNEVFFDDVELDAGAVVGGLTAWVMLDYRAQLRKLADLEKRGFTRRSAPVRGEPVMQQAKEEA